MNATENKFFDYVTARLGAEDQTRIQDARQLVEAGNIEEARYLLGDVVNGLRDRAGFVQALCHVITFGPEHYDDFRELGILPKDL